MANYVSKGGARSRCHVCGRENRPGEEIHMLGWAAEWRAVCGDCVDTTCTRCWRAGVELLGDAAVCAACLAGLPPAGGR